MYVCQHYFVKLRSRSPKTHRQGQAGVYHVTQDIRRGVTRGLCMLPRLSSPCQRRQPLAHRRCGRRGPKHCRSASSTSSDVVELRTITGEVRSITALICPGRTCLTGPGHIQESCLGRDHKAATFRLVFAGISLAALLLESLLPLREPVHLLSHKAYALLCLNCMCIYVDCHW